jgi:hypothetical protein
MKHRSNDLFMAFVLAAGVVVILTLIGVDIEAGRWCGAHGYDWTTAGRGSVLCVDREGRLIKPWSRIVH